MDFPSEPVRSTETSAAGSAGAIQKTGKKLQLIATVKDMPSGLIPSSSQPGNGALVNWSPMHPIHTKRSSFEVGWVPATEVIVVIRNRPVACSAARNVYCPWVGSLSWKLCGKVKDIIHVLPVLFCIPYHMHIVFLIPIPNYSLVPRFKQLHNMKGPSLTPRPPSTVMLGLVRQYVDGGEGWQRSTRLSLVMVI